MGETENGNCDICSLQNVAVNRKYYNYDVKCECCNGENDDHFEIIYYCNNCESKPPQTIKLWMSPKEILNDEI